MKQLQSNFTTLEQSKRLLALGVPEWTVDCVTSRYGGSTFFVQECQLLRRCIDSDNYVPCWSVGRLIEIITICSAELYTRLLFSRIDDHTNIENLIHYISAEIENGHIDFSKLEK